MERLNSIVKESTIEIKTIEEAVDESIKEMQEIEAKKDFEEFKQMEEQPLQKMKDYLELQKAIHDSKKEIIENRITSMKSESKILEVAEKNNKVICSVDNKFNKVMAALFVIFFLLGVITGMLDESWKPYLADLLSIAKTSSNIIR
jgi:predicted transcriptional regulator